MTESDGCETVTLPLFLVVFLCFTVGPCLIALLVVGYREQVRKVTKSANRNAGYWAESEAQRQETELENARLRGSLETSQSCYLVMSKVAKEAIHAAELSEFPVPVHRTTEGDDSILNIGDEEIG